ncbi:GDP-mannose 4,6-dehydratase [bacterium]|nr:GDP-mannose 4,6-dehydratase [bacterium]
MVDWSQESVFITGADGFIGSHLTEALVRRGASVRALVYYNSWNQFGWLSDLPREVFDSVEVVFGDVRDGDLMRRCCRDTQTVFHLASLISIPYSYTASESYVQTNVQGTQNVARGALEAGARRFVHTSTSEIYGTARTVPIDERHPLQPQSPYSASKIGADMMALSFHHAFELPVAVARPFNTFGPRQTPRAIIPTIILQCLANAESGQPIHLGALDPRRDFTFVEDTVRGFLAVAESDAAVGQVLNIAAGQDISIGELAERIMKLLDVDLAIETEGQRVRPAGSEVRRLLGDATRLREQCGWSPEVELDEGLSRVIEWLRPRAQTIDSKRYWT